MYLMFCFNMFFILAKKSFKSKFTGINYQETEINVAPDIYVNLARHGSDIFVTDFFLLNYSLWCKVNFKKEITSLSKLK